MSVLWYYSVNGENVGPISWEELCSAVKDGKLGPDDLVWTSAFGREWRKASSLKGLFGLDSEEEPVKATDESSKEANESVENNTGAQQEKIVINLCKSPFYNDGVVPEKGIFKALKRAWAVMLCLLFARGVFFSRWLPLAICFMFVSSEKNFNVNNIYSIPESQLTSVEKEQRSVVSDYISRQGLDAVFTTGIFAIRSSERFNDAYTFVKDYNPQKRLSWSEEDKQEYTEKLNVIYEEVLFGVRETMRQFLLWANSGHWDVLLYFFFIAFGIKLAMIWFASRGKMMVLRRFYKPNEGFYESWFGVKKTYSVLFKQRVMIELLAIAFVFALLSIDMYVFLRPDSDLEILKTCSVWSIIVFVVFLIGYTLTTKFLVDFVSLRILLRTFRKKFSDIFKGFGFWYIKYLLAYALLMFLLSAGVGILMLFVGASALAAFLAIPLLGQLVILPFLIVEAAWHIELVFDRFPYLRFATPDLFEIELKKNNDRKE